MSSPCDALAEVHPFVTTPITIHPFYIVSHISPMSVGDQLPNSFFGYLFDGEEENSFASHVE
jgi:hypothetical protein